MSNLVRDKVPYLAFLFGVLLFLYSPKWSVFYAVLGAAILAVFQIRYLAKNEGIKGIFIPTKSMFKELQSSDALPFKIGFAMFISPFVTIILNTVWLHASYS